MTKSNKVYVTQQGTAVAVELAPYGPIEPLRVLIMVTLYDFNQNVSQNDTYEFYSNYLRCVSGLYSNKLLSKELLRNASFPTTSFAPPYLSLN